MSDFTVFISSGKKTAAAAKALKKVASTYREILGSSGEDFINVGGATGLIVKNGSHQPAFYSDERGFAIAKGLIYNAKDADPSVDLKRALDEFLSGNEPDLDKYEGAFAMCLYNARDDSALLLNDQSVQMSLYWGERDGGLWATTRILPLVTTIGAQLDPEGALEFCARGILMTPTTLYKDFKRLDVGRHLSFRNGTATQKRHWSPYRPQLPIDRFDEALAMSAAKTVDTLRRSVHGRKRIICDLTGGYDTRLQIAAADFAGIQMEFTTNGPEDNEDVIISRHIAREMGWTHHVYPIADAWNEPMGEEKRRKLVYLSGGDFPFTQIMVQSGRRADLAQRYDLHLSSGGGETFRNFNWNHEFFDIGRRKPASVDRTIRYRVDYDGTPPAGLYRSNWRPAALERLRNVVREVSAIEPDSLNTQQLDAFFLWRMSGASALYCTSFSWFMNHALPFMQAGVQNAAMSVPWQYRMTSMFQRALTHYLSPKLASFPTVYGSTAGLITPRTVPMEVSQLAKRASYFGRKVNKVLFKGRAPGLKPIAPPVPTRRGAYLNPEFRAFMDPEKMRIRGLFNPEGLASFMRAPDEHILKNEWLYLKLATLESVCREIGCEPGASLLPDD